MLTVDDYELVRRKFFVDGQGARSIAKNLGHSRKTVFRWYDVLSSVAESLLS